MWFRRKRKPPTPDPVEQPTPAARASGEAQDDGASRRRSPGSPPPAGASPVADPHLHLYFGVEGRVPIGIDSSFPTHQVAAAEDHVRWAQILADAGVYFQAQQQLDLLGEGGECLAATNWLRARLELVRYRNFLTRSQRVPDAADVSFVFQDDTPERINRLIDAAVELAPDFGPAWLLAAEVALGAVGSRDSARALVSAERAKDLLGETSAVQLALGRALLGVGRALEAASVLRRIPEQAEEWSDSRAHLRRAELHAQAMSESASPEALLEVGRQCARDGKRDQACDIFTRLAQLHPTRAEGHYGLAWLAFLNSQYDEAHRLCQEAIRCNPRFGRAHELLGSIFRNRGGEDPLPHYRRALEFDPTCDTAMWLLAEDYLFKRRELQPAIELLERAARLETTNPSVYSLLASIYMGTRQFGKMEAAGRKAKELSPHTEMHPFYEQRILSLCGFEY